MPLDILCPSCRSSFPVTNAGSEFHVECPSCDAGIGVSVEHPDAHRIGSVPRASAALAPAPAAKQVPATVARPRRLDDDDDAPGRGKGGTSAWVVVVGSTIGLLLVLAVVGTTGYFLFTNLDTDDPPPPSRTKTATGGPNVIVTPTTPPPRPGGIAPRPNPFPTPPGTPPRPFATPPFVTPPAGIVIKDAPVTPVAITPLAGGGDGPFTIKLPGRVDLAQVGGGGRYLVLTFQEPRKLVVYDLCSGSTIAERGIDRDQMTFAVGMNKLVVAYPGRRLLQYYTFPELKPDGESQIPLKSQQVSGIAMGSATNGPLFVAGMNEIALVDLESKALIDGSAKNTSMIPFGSEFRASHNGKLFTAAIMNFVLTFKVENGKWVEGRVTAMPPPLVGADGDVLYSDEQLYTPDGQPTGPRVHTPGTRGMVVPATHGPQFLKLTGVLFGGAGKPGMTATVHTGRELTTPTATIGELPELIGPGQLLTGGPLGLDRHVYFVPGAKMLAVIPPSRDKIVLRRVKLD